MPTKKQTAFINEYLKSWNGADAARKAGYSARSAPQIAQRLLTKDDIRAEIDARLAEMQMSADEVLKLLSDIARGDMGEFLDITSASFNIDMAAAQRKGLTKLIRKVKQKSTIYVAKKESDEDREIHEQEIELYDALSALEKIGKYHKLFKDVDVGVNGKVVFEIVREQDE